MEESFGQNMGRLLNHSRKNANVKPQLVVVDGLPYIAFTATRDVAVGEELLFDYGERRPEQLAMFPWLKE